MIRIPVHTCVMTESDDIRRAGDEMRAARGSYDAALAKLRGLVIAGFRAGMTPQQLIDASGVARRTVYKWIALKENR